jgi:23S rRNA pseudouridine1911/1915/1917 synthase
VAESAIGLSRSAALRLIHEGRVTLNGVPANPAEHVAAGDVVEVMLPEPHTGRATGETIALDVVYEDDDLVVVNKAAGMVVHPAPGHDSGTLVNALLGLGGQWSTAGGEERPGIVHRLDKGTSGLIVAARNDAAHRALSSQLAGRTLSRTYQAIVRGAVRTQSGELEGAIGRNPRDRKRMAVVAGGRFARTRYEVLERKRAHTLVRCDLDTGRTHQIRVHVAALGHPIAGDVEYGGRRPGEPDRPMLHAWRLRLRHPRTGAEMRFEAAPPADFNSYWASLA